MILEIALHNPRQHRQFQQVGEPFILVRGNDDAAMWMPVAPSAERDAQAVVQISPAECGIQLTKAGCEIVCDSAVSCRANDTMHLPVPAHFSIGDTLFEIVDAGLPSQLAARPLQKLLADKDRPFASGGMGVGPSPATLSRWFEALGSLDRWSASLQEMYIQAARCAVDSIGLDGAVVLRRRDNHWEIAASHLPHPELGIHCDAGILNELLNNPQTLFHGADDYTEIAEADSQRNVEAAAQPALVISPLRNDAGDLVGAIYGYRSVRAGNARRGIRYLEAHLTELLAGAVSDGIARTEREAEVDRRRVLMEHAFGSQEHGSRRMFAEQREASLLFADLRRFTDLAESLDMEQVYELLGQVMDCLTAAVLDHDGLVIDYFGDGLAAMWNAPADQADHAELACRAAVRMLDTLPDVAADWADLITDRLRLGIGVHTGMVQVGNSGSKRRMKYGPRGPNVHVASRVESATKELVVPLIITESTARRLSNRFVVHRICRARMRGIDEPTNLFTLAPPQSDHDASISWSCYDQALRLFENDQLNEAAEMLGKVDPASVAVPTSFLLEHIERAIGRQRRRRSTDKRSTSTHGVITLSAK